MQKALMFLVKMQHHTVVVIVMFSNPFGRYVHLCRGYAEDLHALRHAALPRPGGQCHVLRFLVGVCTVTVEMLRACTIFVMMLCHALVFLVSAASS